MKAKCFVAGLLLAIAQGVVWDHFTPAPWCYVGSIACAYVIGRAAFRMGHV